MKLWGGRFGEDGHDPEFEKFSESFSLDQRLVHYDLRVNRAYVDALGAGGVLSKQEVRRLTRGLATIRRYIEAHPDWARGEVAEDVHTWVEARLHREVGDVAKKLRTGRSRNDLVATEMRLFAKDAIVELERAALEVLQALLKQATTHIEAVMPGYTHLQAAQPVLFSHYLLAYFEMFLRDVGRLEDCRHRTDELPMGAGALAGTAFPLDRKRLARELGFARVARNSLDVTSDRDFACELLFVCALASTHLSRLAEDLVIFSSPGFRFVELDDIYATGSSLMPQKKNPDTLELIRGKTARVSGRLATLLGLLKGLPLAYNRDLQEDKSALFDGIDTTRDGLRLTGRVIRTLRTFPERMKSATAQGFLTATDLADELVRRGIPFGVAHEQVGKLVRYCAEKEETFASLTDSEARRFLPTWDAQLRSIALSPEYALRRRNVIGGTAPVQVARQLREGERTVIELQRRIGRLA